MKKLLLLAMLSITASVTAWDFDEPEDWDSHPNNLVAQDPDSIHAQILRGDHEMLDENFNPRD